MIVRIFNQFKFFFDRYNFSLNTFISVFYVLFFLIYNFYCLLIIFPPYGPVEYSTKIYQYLATNLSEFDDKLLFIFSIFIIPIFFSINNYIGNSTKKKLIYFFTLLFFIYNSFLLFKIIYHFMKINFDFSFFLKYFSFFLFEIILFVIFLKKYHCFEKYFIFYYDKINFINLFLFILNLIFYKPLNLNFTFDNFDYVKVTKYTYFYDLSNFLDSYYSIFLFIFFSFLILFFFLKFRDFQPMEKKYHSYPFLIFIIIIIFSLFETSFEMNIHHYAPIVGTALHLSNGEGVLGYNVHSQYGYFFVFLLSLLFKFMPETFGTAGFFIRFINLITICIYILIFYKISKFKIFGTLLGLIIISFHLKFSAVNFASFPSLLGIRNLIPLLCIFTFLFFNNYFKLRIFLLNTLICISSITSLEVFLFSLFPYIITTFSQSFNSIDSFKKNLKSIAQTFIIIFLFHIILNIFYFYEYGFFIQYKIYFEILNNMISGSWWPTPTIKFFILPFSFLTIYSIAIIYCLSYVKKSYLNPDSYNSKELIILTLVISYGVLSMLYYISRSLPSNLQVVALPIYLLLYLFLEKLLINLKISNYYKVLLSLIFLYLTYHSSIFLSENSNRYVNGKNLLNKFFHSDYDISNHFKELIHTSHNYPNNTREYSILNEAVTLINNEYKDKKLILFFGYDFLSGIPEIVFSMTNKWYFHPISFTFSDELSQYKINQILEKNSKIKENDKITILNTDVHRLEQQIINDIKDNWNLCVLNNNYDYFTVFYVSKNDCK